MYILVLVHTYIHIYSKMLRIMVGVRLPPGDFSESTYI